MNPFEMVVAIVVVVTAGRFLTAAVRTKHGNRDDAATDDGATRAELDRLRDRVEVLERIATDAHGPQGLAHEIERLRVEDRR